MTEEDNIQAAQKALDHFGYLVIVSERKLVIGAILDTGASMFTSFEGQVTVISKATRSDFLELCDYWECPRYIPMGHKYFYKVKAE